MPIDIEAVLALLPELFPGEQKIPLANIRPNPNNPGPTPSEEQIQEMADDLAGRGLQSPIKVWALRSNPLREGRTLHLDNPRLRGDNQPWEVGDFNWEILSGELRYLGANRLGRNEMNGYILNPTPGEAVDIAHTDNDVRQRGWFADWQTIENRIKAEPGMTQRQVAARLRMDKDKVGRALGLLPLLNPESRALIVGVSDNSNKGVRGISEMAAAQLAGLGPESTRKPGVRGSGEVQALWPYPAIPPETQDLVLRALRVAIDRELTEAQTEELVSWLQAGGPLEEFNPTPRPPAKTRKSKADHLNHQGHQVHQEKLSSETEAKTTANHLNHHPLQNNLGAGHQVHQENLSSEPEDKTTANHQNTKETTLGKTLNESNEEESALSSLFWQWMLGIKFISQLKSKVKKGEALTLSEKILVGTYRLYEWVLKPIGKHTGKFFKWVFKGVWHSLKEALGKVFGKTVEVVLPWLIVAAIVWGILVLVHFVVVSPTQWLEGKLKSALHWGSTHAEEPVTPVSTPASSTVVPSADTSNVVSHTGSHTEPVQAKLGSRPVVSTQLQSPITYQPAVSFVPLASPSKTLYDPKILELETAAIPKNCIVKDYPMTPDEGIPGDLAVSRMQDMTDPDKYTMMIGNSKQILSSVNATTTNLIVNYKSADPLGGFLDGAGPLNAFWEDVKYIHINEMDTEKGNVLYQCSLVVSGAKYPLTIQCASSEDLEHLVSTLEYFIRSSRLAHDAQPAGLPFLDQGMILKNDNQVTVLWADSPAANAGLKCGDRIWSLDKSTPSQQSKSDLEAQLQSLTSGTHLVCAVTAQEWNKAMRDRSKNPSGRFNPKEERLKLIVP